MKNALAHVACLITFTCTFLVSPAIRAEEAVSSDSIVYQDWQDSKRGRSVPIKIYLPQNNAANCPVVIFSHGLGGSREAAVYLGDYWAEHGYVGIFVQHAGSDTGVWKPAVAGGRQAIMERMKAAANGQNLVDRAQDVKFVIDELEQRSKTDPVLKNRVNLQEIAIAGHSFGAGTALAIAGQSFGAAGTAQDSRVKAAIYLCPPVTGRLTPQQAYGGIQIPGLLLTGTEDNSPIRETKAEDRRIPFDGMKSPHQYLVNFVGADQATFGGRAFRAPKEGDDKYHDMIDVVTTKFLDAALKNDASAWRWLDSTQVTAYLGKTAMFEKK